MADPVSFAIPIRVARVAPGHPRKAVYGLTSVDHAEAAACGLDPVASLLGTAMLWAVFEIFVSVEDSLLAAVADSTAI